MQQLPFEGALFQLKDRQARKGHQRFPLIARKKIASTIAQSTLSRKGEYCDKINCFLDRGEIPDSSIAKRAASKNRLHVLEPPRDSDKVCRMVRGFV